MRDLLPMSYGATRPIESAAPGVAGIRIVMVNVYGVNAGAGNWVMVDTGLPFSAGKIRDWVKRQFHDRPPSAILLTHGHFDHVGNLRDLADGWDVPVYAHPLEMPYLTGRSKYPPSDPTVGGGVMPWTSPLFPAGPFHFGDRLRELPEDGSVPYLLDWRWIHTPGHSPGHVSYFRDDDRVLIAGDAVITTKQESAYAIAKQIPEMHGPPAFYTPDWEAATLSVQRLADLQPSIIACGHGLPLVGPAMEDALDYLAENFDEIARPTRGRYFRRPAVMDERGLISVPPPVVGSVPTLLIGLGLAGLLAYALTRKPRAAV